MPVNPTTSSLRPRTFNPKPTSGGKGNLQNPSPPDEDTQEDDLMETEEEGGEEQQALPPKKKKIQCEEALRALRIVELYFAQEELDPQEEFFPDFVQMRGGIIRAGKEQIDSDIEGEEQIDSDTEGGEQIDSDAEGEESASEVEEMASEGTSDCSLSSLGSAYSDDDELGGKDGDEI